MSRDQYDRNVLAQHEADEVVEEPEKAKPQNDAYQGGFQAAKGTRMIPWPLPGRGCRGSIRGTVLGTAARFLCPVWSTRSGEFRLDQRASGLNPPGFGGFRLGGNSYSTTSQPG